MTKFSSLQLPSEAFQPSEDGLDAASHKTVADYFQMTDTQGTLPVTADRQTTWSRALI